MLDPAHFYSRTRDARKVIVVDLGFLGDTVHLVPALWELKSAYRRAELHVLTTPVGAEVLRMARCVDRAWELELRPGRRSLREQLRLIRALRKERFDVAYNFSGADRAIYFTAMTGARRRVAQRGGRWHFYNPWLIPCWVARQDSDLVVYEQRRRALTACGLQPGPVRFDLEIDEPSTRPAAELVPPLAAHVSPSSSKPTREWPLEFHAVLFRAVWEALPETHFLLSSSAQPRERERVRALLDLVKDPRLETLPADLTIPQLGAVLRRCRLHLGPDSGVLHLAAALGVRTVSFFREQGAYRSFMPSGMLHRVISVPCHCVDGHEAPCEQLGLAECFAQISPAKVALLVREQLLVSKRSEASGSRA